MSIVFDTPEEIEFFQLCALKGACKLYRQGIRMASWGGRSPVKLARERYGLTGNADKVIEQLDVLINQAIDRRRNG